jgi:hypothetical protein
MTGAEHPPIHDTPAMDVDRLLDRAVAGVPRWRRARTRRELACYVDDACADLVSEGLDPGEAMRQIRARFGDPEPVASGFRSLPPPYWARPARRSAGPVGIAVLGLVIGLALVQVRTADRYGGSPALVAETAEPARLQRLHVREVAALQAPVERMPATNVAVYPISRRLGAVPAQPDVLEPSVQALTPAWLPEGYNADRGQLFLSPSATLQYFDDTRGEQPGIMVEVLRPDRTTVFQVKERHIRPITMGDRPGFFIDGEWEVRGPLDEQPAPATWRTDRSRSLLFAWDDLIVLVAGPAELQEADLLRIARSLQTN